jgi:hypothetical protein
LQKCHGQLLNTKELIEFDEKIVAALLHSTILKFLFNGYAKSDISFYF